LHHRAGCRDSAAAIFGKYPLAVNAKELSREAGDVEPQEMGPLQLGRRREEMVSAMA
jgi:hypothetical protein